jgi:hypothetical protein
LACHEDLWKNESRSPLILNLGIKWGRVVSFMPPFFAPRDTAPSYLKLSHYRPGQALTVSDIGGSKIRRLSAH